MIDERLTAFYLLCSSLHAFWSPNWIYEVISEHNDQPYGTLGESVKNSFFFSSKKYQLANLLLLLLLRKTSGWYEKVMAQLVKPRYNFELWVVIKDEEMSSFIFPAFASLFPQGSQKWCTFSFSGFYRRGQPRKHSRSCHQFKRWNFDLVVVRMLRSAQLMSSDNIDPRDKEPLLNRSHYCPNNRLL